jgi:hypothetical protein
MLGDFSRPGLTVGQRLRYLFASPGWSHDGSRMTSEDIKADYVVRHPSEAGRPGLPALGSTSSRLAPGE